MLNNSLIDSTENCVKPFLMGVQAAYPGISVDVDSQIIMINKDRQNKVALISGGGSGHEPFGAGFVGENMLTGFILGSLHSSPPSKLIYSGMMNLLEKNKGGILVLVLNYMDYKLNFGIAVEKLKLLGIKVESVYVSEDCVHGKYQAIDCGRRGCCGIALISKIIGGLSSKGYKLKHLKKEAEEINSRMYTLSAVLSPYTLLHKDQHWKMNNEINVEVGVGLNGEKGIKTVKTSSIKGIVESLLASIYQEAKIKFHSENDVYVILINNLGICTDLEMFIIAHEVVTQIEKWNIVMKRVYVGKMLTSLDTKGFHLTILNITGKKNWLTQLDSNTDAFGWTSSAYRFVQAPPITFKKKKSDLNLIAGIILTNAQARICEDILINICSTFEDNESKLNQLDQLNGNCGTCLKKLASGVRRNIKDWDLRDLTKTFFLISEIAESQMEGMYGALYSLMMMGAASNSYDWITIWKAALEKVHEYTNAKIGNRTMVDALEPGFLAFVDIMAIDDSNWQDAIDRAVASARDGCYNTSLTEYDYEFDSVDAGAYSVVICLESIQASLKMLALSEKSLS